MNAPALVYGYYSDKGIREENQDALLTLPGKYMSTFGVADGIGGYEHGREAAKMTLDAIEGELRACDEFNTEYVFRLLEKKYEQINKHIYKLGQSMSMRMGTTLSLLSFIGEKYILSNVGDTRIYQVRDGAIKTISKLHNVAGEEYEKGAITYEQYKNHKQKNVLTMCIGMNSLIEPYFLVDSLKPKDTYIICSDGIYNFVSDEYLLNAFESKSFTSNSHMMDECRELGFKALENRGDDNLTIIAVRILS